MVGSDILMTNCCALAGAVAKSPTVKVPTVTSRPMIPCISTSSLDLLSFLASGEQIPHSDQRDIRDVGDQRQGDEIDYHERDDAAIDHLELEAEHRLRHENVDPERRVEKADRQVDGHHDAEVHRVD